MLNKQIIIGLIIFLKNIKSKDDLKIPDVVSVANTKISLDESYDEIRNQIWRINHKYITDIFRSI